MYILNYLEDNGITATGALHLSQAKWNSLTQLWIGNCRIN